jgi:hypothetical protein
MTEGFEGSGGLGDEGCTLNGFPRADGVLWKTAHHVILGDQWYFTLCFLFIFL